MSKTILLNHSNWHFTKENPGIPAAVMGEAITLRLVLCSAAILGGIFIVALWGQRHAVPRPDGNRCGQSADTAPRR